MEVADVLQMKKKHGRKKKKARNADHETTITRCKVPRVDFDVIIIEIFGSMHILKFDYFAVSFG